MRETQTTPGNQGQYWEPFAAYIVVCKFILSLFIGGLAILFSELVRREDTARFSGLRAL